MCSSEGRRSPWRHSWTCPRGLRGIADALSSTSLDKGQMMQTMSTNGAPWGRRGGTNTPSPVPSIRPSTPEIARTAPPTPVRDIVDKKGQLHKSTKFSSTPLLDPGSDWDLSRAWQDDKENKEGDSGGGRYPDPKELSQSHRNISGDTQSVIQKFRKSFSLRFYKKGGSSSSKDGEEDEPPPLPPDELNAQDAGSGASDPPEPESPSETPPPSDVAPLPTKEDNSSQEKFRLGPLVWRSSKERKKGKKAARSAKCNSGDSGIQIEMVGRAGDSSESHDTDNLADDEIADDLDSPPVVRRRGTASSSEGRSSRPTSDVINQFLIDRLKAELEARGLRKRGQVGVRRTYSDLGGQRLYNWEMRRGFRRMVSHPSPLRSKPNRENSLSNNSNSSNSSNRNWRRPHGRPAHLRRSVSQPLGINELSPLMLRKTTGGRNHVLSEDERGGGGTSDDEMLSDSESSVASLTDRKKSFELAMDEEVVILAEAVWDHVAMETEELAFRAGDVIEVLDTLDKDWWWGAKGQQTGWFPSAFVRLRVSQEDTVEDCLAAVAAGKGTKTLRRRVSVSLLSNDQVRSRVVTELINTERDFVKILRDVQEGYLTECRRRVDMFSEDQIRVIFSNLEELLEFQEKFLIDLETKVDWEAPYKSCLADVFLQHRAGFRMYSEYCNSHPLAIATLQELYRHIGYDKFFEACRLMRGLMEIPLDGYLLTPVQRICKYPLQLAELLKYTKTDHEDYDKIKEALEAMRGVAVLINERKRRMESLEKLAMWQSRVEGWEGEDLIETSSQLIHQGEAIRVTSGMWTSNIIAFLFDHQLIYCKKDILKRNTYVYKGRISMDSSEVVNLPDGKDSTTGVTVRHGIKVHSVTSPPCREKALVFCLRSAKEKSDWLEAFSAERRSVEQDMVDGLEFAPAARRLARSAINRVTFRPPVKHSKGYKRGSMVGPNDVVTGPSLGRKVGTWFTFGATKKSRGLGRITPPQSVISHS
uniref:Spermatogenesis-associated protein 13 n=1 Tax=Lygus hesperus TaxID=30085 RepID=A0A0A9YF62_LYGHE